MFPFHAADPEKYAAFAKKEEALLEKIKAEIFGDKVEEPEGVVHEESGGVQALLGTAQRRLFEEMSLE